MKLPEEDAMLLMEEGVNIIEYGENYLEDAVPLKEDKKILKKGRLLTLQAAVPGIMQSIEQAVVKRRAAGRLHKSCYINSSPSSWHTNAVKTGRRRIQDLSSDNK